MSKSKQISESIFLEGFKNFFETLHNACTGSRKVTQLDDVAIFEEEIVGKGKVLFYFFHGTAEEQKRFFPGENEAYCTFRNFSSIIVANFQGVAHDFVCEFGYVLHCEELLKAFRQSERSKRSAQWANVQICSHEIRHEMQLCHELNPAKFRTAFPATKKNYEKDTNWEDVKSELEDLYEGYVEKQHEPDYLVRECDAIVTSYEALVEWHKNNSNRSKMQRLIEIIKV